MKARRPVCSCGSVWFHRWSCPRLLEFLDVASVLAGAALVVVTLVDPPGWRSWVAGLVVVGALVAADVKASRARRRRT